LWLFGRTGSLELPAQTQADIGQAIIGVAPAIVGRVLISERGGGIVANVHADAPALIEIDAAAEILAARGSAGERAIMNGAAERRFEIKRGIENRQLPGEAQMAEAICASHVDGGTNFRTRRADPIEGVDIGRGEEHV